MKNQVGLRETLEFKKAYKTLVILRIHKKGRKKETTENSQRDDSAPKSNGKTNEIRRIAKVMIFQESKNSNYYFALIATCWHKKCLGPWK